MRQRLFAWCYERLEGSERAAMVPLRTRLVGDLTGRILEIGCGNGATFAHYRAGAKVIATDYNPHMLSRAADAARASAATITLQEADASALPFEDGSFDAVVASLVLCSVPDQGQALGEIRRVLRPGGAVRLFEHVRSQRRWVAALQRVATPAWGLMGDGCRLHADTESAVRASGLVVGRVEDVHFDVPLRLRRLMIVASRPDEREKPLSRIP